MLVLLAKTAVLAVMAWLVALSVNISLGIVD